ncbi:MAG: thioredoxin [Hydrocarboniphaga sp.]|uniref:thioredoxin family protein n=1 Tax=Hydrocarboniphaga sp. TaxID=2033016 RepID=UPI00261BFB65|nr:thioredoxin family protein [Hydrocarboniphaga sp.]MDB5970826.1 thioredoxin [Hydrocarboniphaga sp.]
MKSFARLLLIGAALATASAQASELLPYTDARFTELTQAHKPLVLDVHADWCPTCRVQQPVLKQLVSAPPYDAYTVLVVNYDDQAEVRQRFKVERQSTLVVFAGTEERGRATGYIDAKSISLLLNKGL